MLKVYYKVRCSYITKEPNYFHGFDIGVFNSIEKAEQAINMVKDKPGFCEHKDKIKIKKRFYLFVPKLLNKIFWQDGFITYKY